MADRALERLLLKAEISQNHWRVWFGGCRLIGNVLSVPDRSRWEALGRMFGAELRLACPDLVIRVLKPAPRLKRLPVPSGRPTLAKLRDLLD